MNVAEEKYPNFIFKLNELRSGKILQGKEEQFLWEDVILLSEMYTNSAD